MCEWTIGREHATIAAMATPEPIPPSRRLRSAAQAERERLTRDLDRVERRAGVLHEELGGLARQAERLRSRLTLLAQVAYDADEDSPSPERLGEPTEHLGETEALDAWRAPLGFLGGAAIRTIAVRVLASSPEPTRPIHYARWFELVRDAGYGIKGRDPLATFLTQIGRSPVVRRAGEPGTYALDLDAPVRLQERIRLLHDELIALHQGQQPIEEIVSGRERRAELTREYARVERALEEALEVLGSRSDDPLARPPAEHGHRRRAASIALA